MFVNELHQGGIRAILDYDPTVFDDMLLPDDVELADVVDNIIYKYGDTPLFTPDPSVIKFYIGRWSKTRLPLWNRFQAAVEEEYDPLQNYDRHEKKELTHGKKVTYSGTITDTPSGTITDSADYTSTDSMAADNSSTFENDTKKTVNGKTNEKTFTSYQEQRSFNNSDTNSGKDSEDNHIYGNIGVTTSQQMLQAELDLIPHLDLIEFISDDWHSEFCLSIYY